MEAVQGLWLCSPKATRAATTLRSPCTHPTRRKQSCPSQPCCLMSSFTLVFRSMRLNESPIHTSSQAACRLFVAALKASFYFLILYMHLFLCPRVSLKWLIWWSVLSLLKEGTFLSCARCLSLCVFCPGQWQSRRGSSVFERSLVQVGM